MTKLTPKERDNIAIWLAEKQSLREIGRRLNRSVSTISDEIKRNSLSSGYRAISAQEISARRNKHSRKHNARKSIAITNYVVDKLRSGWSPEQISGRLKKENNDKTVICHETIYQLIYASENKPEELEQYLTRHHKYRSRKKYNWLPRRGINGRVSIHERPKYINNKKVFGHWETDVVEGKNHNGGMQTMLERKTRYYQAKLIENIDSTNGLNAQKVLLSKYPLEATKSVTMDNGKENFDHKKLNEIGIKTYFCDPYCSWQKGSNENHNGILRRYIPKKTDTKTITQFELDAILEEINNRPRKCLKYETSAEAFRRELKSIKLRKCSDSR
jgi:IS30 family transposase